MAEEKLDLVEFAAGQVAQTRTGAAKIVGRQLTAREGTVDGSRVHPHRTLDAAEGIDGRWGGSAIKDRSCHFLFCSESAQRSA